VDYLQLEDALDIAEALGIPQVRDLGLLESALQRPQLALYGADMYPSLAEKCAALLESMLKNHPMLDGNKRLGWASVSLFLHMNDIAFGPSDDEAFTFVIGIAAGDIDWNEMVAWFDERL
jgi:death-on-curing protein